MILTGPPPVRVRSARLSYRGPGRLNVTLKGQDPIGRAFAPSGKLLGPVIAERRRLGALLEEASMLSVQEQEWRRAYAARREDEAWAWYAPRFLAEMRVSFGAVVRRCSWAELGELEREAWRRGVRPCPDAWAALPRIAAEHGGLLVPVCYCGLAHRAHCHTRLLCAEVFTKLGAVDEGEVPATSRRAGRSCLIVGPPKSAP